MSDKIRETVRYAIRRLQLEKWCSIARTKRHRARQSAAEGDICHPCCYRTRRLGEYSQFHYAKRGIAVSFSHSNDVSSGSAVSSLKHLVVELDAPILRIIGRTLQTRYSYAPR